MPPKIGHVVSQETREKIRKSLIGKSIFSGDKHPMKNPEISKRVSNKLTGRKLSPEHIEKLRSWRRIKPAWNKGKPYPQIMGEKHWRWSGGKGARVERIKTQKLLEQEKLAGRKKPLNCEICGSNKKICFDHDHETGKFRGWICGRCNTALGLVDDNTEVLEKMIKYILKTFRIG